MEEHEPGGEQPYIPRKSHRIRTILIVLVSLLTAGFMAVFLLFNYFGEKMLREYLRNKVLLASDSVYHADFHTIRLNILTGDLSIDSLRLIPDYDRYKFLKNRGLTSRSLYRLEIASLSVDRMHFWQIWQGKRINFRQLFLKQPVIRIVGYADMAQSQNRRWRTVYEDIYPAVSGLFRDFHIDSVVASHGIFLSSVREKTGRRTEGEYEFSAVLKDVSVNPFSYYNPGRVFYSREVDLVIHQFEYYLADSSYAVRAGEIGFSLTRSMLYGKQISLIPDLSRKRRMKTTGSDLFRFDLPAFSVTGVDLYQVLTDKIVDIDSVTLNHLTAKVFRNDKPTGGKKPAGKSGTILQEGLYPIIAKELKFIRIGKVLVRDGAFSYYSRPSEKKPEMEIRKVVLGLSGFLVDSTSYNDPSRLFYSKEIELDLDGFSLSLKDGIHYADAASMHFSTRRSLIDIDQCIIFPDRKAHIANAPGTVNLLDIRVPHLTFTGIDLKKVFNRRVFDFRQLRIGEPDVRYVAYKAPKNPNPRFRHAVDFFEEKNEEVVYNLLKPYLNEIRGEEIMLENGYLQFSYGNAEREIPLVSGSFDLTMYGCRIDSMRGMNRQGYFYSDDFDLTLRSIAMGSADSTRMFHAGMIHVVTADALITAEKIAITRHPRKIPRGRGLTLPHAVSASFTLDRLFLSGLNHKKLFLEKTLVADTILIDHPQLELRSYPLTGSASESPATDSTPAPELIRALEIGRCNVRKGSMSYVGLEDRLASYFSLRDIDFTVVSALVRLPGREATPGLIKFDSLNLKVFPLRAVLADSTYILEADSLDIREYPVNISLRGLKVTPCRKWDPNTGQRFVAGIKIPALDIRGFYFDRAIFDNQWSIDRVSFNDPSLFIETGSTREPPAGRHPFDPEKPFTLPAFMKTAAVGEIAIRNLDFRLLLHHPGKTTDVSWNDVMITATRFSIDSASAHDAARPLFHTEEITLAAPGKSWVSADSLYTFSFDRFSLSTRTRKAQIDTIRYIPNYSREAFSRCTGYQVTRVEAVIPRVELEGIDLNRWLKERSFVAEKAILPYAGISAYLDKRDLTDRGIYQPMPQEALRRVKFPMAIGSVEILNGTVVYEEQTGTIPGRLSLDSLHATITGLDLTRKDPVHDGVDHQGLSAIDVRCTAKFMGKGDAGAWFRLFTDHPRDSFTVKAAITGMELKEINPMMARLVPVAFSRGWLDKAEITGFYAGNEQATGEISLWYEDLAIKLQPERPDPWHRIGREAMTGLINLIIRSRNPDDYGNLKTGMIHYRRDTTRGFFNFVWKSAYSGIRSGFGVETKEQKIMRKNGKNRKSVP